MEDDGDQRVSPTTRRSTTCPRGITSPWATTATIRRTAGSSNKVGYIPRENLVGRAEFLFFSIDGPVWKFWTWPTAVRFGRMFEGIE